MKLKKCVTGYQLKMIALVTMLIDHIAAVPIWRLYKASFGLTASMQLSDAIGDKVVVWIAGNQDLVYQIYEWMRCIGRMAFPIYCFLLVEGFLHTRSVKKYALRLLGFSILSEIPFDLALGGQWWDLTKSNVFFTLVLGLVAIWGISYVEKFYEFWKEKNWEPILGLILTGVAGLSVLAVTGGLAGIVLHSDYGIGGIIAILIIYLCRRQKELGFVLSVLALTVLNGDLEILALIMLYQIMQYNGERGKATKYLFYGFYPVHLLVLALISIALGV